MITPFIDFMVLLLYFVCQTKKVSKLDLVLVSRFSKKMMMQT
ncbi:hypothetical protein WCP94_000182 (plasmid) [Bilophila wadsworthia]